MAFDPRGTSLIIIVIGESRRCGDPGELTEGRDPTVIRGRHAKDPLEVGPIALHITIGYLRAYDHRYQHIMRPLRYSINVTLDGCVDHRAGIPNEEIHRHAAENIARADALLFGRVTYEMMEVWRSVAQKGPKPDWVEPWMEPFAGTIDAAKKYVVSSTLERVDWNAEFLRGDLETAVRQLKQEPGTGLLTGGVKLPLTLAELGLIDEYEFVVHPRVAGHGPTLLAGLSKPIDLKLVSRLELGSGMLAMRYEPRR